MPELWGDDEHQRAMGFHPSIWDGEEGPELPILQPIRWKWAPILAPTLLLAVLAVLLLVIWSTP